MLWIVNGEREKGWNSFREEKFDHHRHQGDSQEKKQSIQKHWII